MADPIAYDQDGKPVIPAAWRPHENHRYSESFGKCGTCGKDRWHPEHFNGDGEAARLAMESFRKYKTDLADWLSKLAVGAPVQVKDDHPTQAMQGMVGNVTAIQREMHKPDIVTVRFRDREVAVKSQWLVPPPLPEPPPRFASQEEADQWLEDTAKEMGIRTEPIVPKFSSPEEADEWMRRQQGEPYVPPSWQPDSDPDSELDQRIFALLQKSIKPMNDVGRAAAFGTTAHQALEATMKKVRGPHPQMVILDEAAQMTTDDDVIDPYA